MGKKKILNFTINGIPILSRNDDGEWNVFKKADTHFIENMLDEITDNKIEKYKTTLKEVNKEEKE